MIFALYIVGWAISWPILSIAWLKFLDKDQYWSKNNLSFSVKCKDAKKIILKPEG